MRSRLITAWYRSSLTPLTACLLPFSFVFRLIIAIRRWLYQHHYFKSTRLPVPVIVVGNITVGGTGKTPFVIWLADFLKKAGYQPGIVSRGAGSAQLQEVHAVTSSDHAKDVGDEPLMLFLRTDCPVYVGKNRVLAARTLLQQTHCDIVISDDGLQHYALERDIECVLIDRYRHFGNQQLLPAGPLREPIHRLSSADIVINDLTLMLGKVISVTDALQKKSLNEFANETVHAIAGIANPQSFFDVLRSNRCRLVEHVFPDHYAYRRRDFLFNDQMPILMTEKDAVKCREFAIPNTWYLEITVQPADTISQQLKMKLDLLKEKQHAQSEEDFSSHTCHKYPHH